MSDPIADLNVALDGPDLATGSATLASLRRTAEFHSLLAGIEPRWKAVMEWERGLGS